MHVIDFGALLQDFDLPPLLQRGLGEHVSRAKRRECSGDTIQIRPWKLCCCETHLLKRSAILPEDSTYRLPDNPHPRILREDLVTGKDDQTIQMSRGYDDAVKGIVMDIREPC